MSTDMKSAHAPSARAITICWTSSVRYAGLRYAGLRNLTTGEAVRYGACAYASLSSTHCARNGSLIHASPR